MPGCKPGDKAVIIGPLPNDKDYCDFLAENIGTFVTVNELYIANPVLVFTGIIQDGTLFKCESRHPLNIHVPFQDPVTKEIVYLHRKQYGDIIPDKWLQPIRPLGDADEMNKRKENGTSLTNGEFSSFAREYRKELKKSRSL